MKKRIFILTAIIAASSFLHSEEQQTSSEELNPHRIYFGGDIFNDHFNTNVSSWGQKVHIKSNAIFGGFRMGYDYIKPKGFYFGIDGLGAIGGATSTQNIAVHGWHHFKKKFHNSPLLINLEQREGYTFQSPLSRKSTIIPFLGLGWYYSRPQYDNANESTNWLYGAVGLRVNQEFSKNFDVGFNVKAMYAFAGSHNATFWSKSVKERINNTWGYEICLPFTWHIGRPLFISRGGLLALARKWDIQIQPYLLKLDVNGVSQILGVRFLTGYSF